MKTKVMPRPTAEPRWPAYVAAVAVGSILAALPDDLMVVPNQRGWMFGIFLALLIPTVIAHYKDFEVVNRWFGITLNWVQTAALVALVGYFITRKHDLEGLQLLWSGAILWWTNVLVFALWYWRLDAGGPHRRAMRETHDEAAFLFPQLTLPPGSPLYDKGWKPQFIDYLFLAFNTSAAFSPTDVPVLGRRAKGVMMVQAFISLMLVAVLLATAVNKGS